MAYVYILFTSQKCTKIFHTGRENWGIFKALVFNENGTGVSPLAGFNKFRLRTRSAMASEPMEHF